MEMIEIIEKKRDGGELTTGQINWFVQAYSAGEVPDYQAAALMMAICIRGMNQRETVDLTTAMVNSGEQIDLHDVVPYVVDKHSSGGVGDKTTLVVQPIVAACGVPVGKMSGRGLGPSGGTLDKMESFPGWTPDLPIERFKRQLADIGLVLAGQTARLAPADGKLYELRGVTGTIDNVSLIAASIMSKKLAAGADAIVLDVKAGNGAFMTTVDDARELARIMVGIGQDAGRKTVALISDMNQPLGHAVGNVLEVVEAIEALKGGGPADLWSHCLEVSCQMLLLAGKANSLEEAFEMAVKARDDGRALAKFKAMVSHQGGDDRLVDNPRGFRQAKVIEQVVADRSGFIAGIDAGAIGWSSLQLGAGCRVKGDEINHAVGMVIPVKVGDQLQQGDLLGTIYSDDEYGCAVAKIDLGASITWSDTPVRPLPHLYDTIS
jgi:pyrimidine-nucleoside phosphorylase